MNSARGEDVTLRLQRYAVERSSMLSGCATSSGIIVNPSAKRTDYQSAFLVVHGDRSSDMDAEIQKELLRHGLSITIGPEGSGPGESQLIIRYEDDWKWDLKMYLRSFDLMVFDAKSKVLLSTGSWKNSLLHGFYDEDKVVAQIVDQTLSQVRSS